ncbi:MAG: response regulator [Desulfuromonas sp.]|uniref:response regulator n=1 Tax=Desulfuromonas sp. TaxID=892 RepID=UPI000CBF29C2|nr:response regulator [Desulfuromonas sp.]PLX84282.1 MAG: response regulator [Desulfuromonas sp.]
MNNAILIVDDEEQVIKALQRTLMDEDYEICSARSGKEALNLLQSRNFKVVISDERMPGMQGSELLSIVSLRYPEAARIILTGHASIDAAMKAVNEGQIYRFLVKPWNEMELRLAIRAAIEKYDLETRNRKLLALVRNQALKLEMLEKKHPGIAHLEKSEDGRLIVSEMSEDEAASIMAECQVGDLTT